MKKVIVLGGTHDHISLLLNLKKRGYHTILIDYYENPMARTVADVFIRESTLDKERVLSISKVENVGLVIATCIDQALLTMAFVSEILGLPCHLSFNTANELTNKMFMKKKFEEFGVPSARFFVVEKLEEKERCIKLNMPVVVKPTDANSSKGVEKIYLANQIPAAIERAMNFSRSGKVIVEEYMEGTELSVDAIIHNGEPHILMITENVKVQNDELSFTIIQSIYRKEVHLKYKDLIKDVVAKIAGAFKLDNVPLLVQVIVKDGTVSVIEFSSRIGGGSKCHLIKRVTGFDVMDYFLNVIEGKIPDSIESNCYDDTVSVNYAYAFPGNIQLITGVQELLDENVMEEFYQYKGFGSQITQSKYSTDRPIGYMVSAPNYQLLSKKLAICDKRLRIENPEGIDLMIHAFLPIPELRT